VTRLLVVGDALLDRDVHGAVERICPDAPAPVVDVAEEVARPGGAALAAALLALDGFDVALLTAIGDDPAGDKLRQLLAERSIDIADLGLRGETPEKIRVRAGGQSLLRIDRGRASGIRRRLRTAKHELFGDADAVLLADYGHGVATLAGVRRALTSFAERRPLVWDPHPRGARPVPGARLVTPNDAEARRFARRSGPALTDAVARARTLVASWQADGVAVTLGARGAILARPSGAIFAVPAIEVSRSDACGAGDRFAGAATAALAQGAILPEAVERAVDVASAFVAAGGAAAIRANGPVPAGRAGAAQPYGTATVQRVRTAGGTVVATGGCFDLLHPGHVGMLEAARRLGDCLVVLLNADDSVRRLKGPGRPIQTVADRAAMLRALACVDEVVVFDDDTPIAALERLRPDVFVKGADYSAESLPEAPVIAAWGGQALVVPYLAGRSTTRLVEEVTNRVNH
jgi:D-beta-D-heptose 7-phosphate kinase / D-beta-D-heptose 1-phosphate adenosyltransferase